MITSEMSRDEGEAANMPQQPYYQFKIIQINRLRKISFSLNWIWACMNAREGKRHIKRTPTLPLYPLSL